MKFYNYILEVKKLKGTMIGFGLNPTQLKRIYDYIESWLIKFKIDYEKVTHPHFTIAQIPGTYPKDELMRKINEFDLNIKFNPKDLTIFSGVNIKKDFIVLEYKPNIKFIEYLNSIEDKFEVRKFGAVQPHASIFTTEQGGLDGKILNDMKYSLPRLPVLRPTEIELWNNKFEIETRIK